MVDGTDNRAQTGAGPGEAADGHDDAPRAASPRKPVSFDFKLRLTSPDDGPTSTPPRELGVELEPLDLAAITGVRPDEPRAYQTDGDLQSLIVELANQIADPNTASTPVVRVTASATIEKSRKSRPEPVAPSVPASRVADAPSAPPAAPVAPTVAASAPPLAPTPPLSAAPPAMPTPPIVVPTLPRIDVPTPAPLAPVPDPAAAAARPEPDPEPDPEPVELASVAVGEQVEESVEESGEAQLVDAEVVAEEQVEQPVEPVEVEPVAEQPAVVEQSVAAEPVAAEPVAAEPVAAEPVAAEPVAAEPVAAEPVAVAQPEVAEPAPVAQPVLAQPVLAAPVEAPTVAEALAAPAVGHHTHEVIAPPPRPVRHTTEVPAVAAPAPAAASPVAAASTGPVMVSNAAAMAAAAAVPTAPAAPAALNLAKIERRPGAERPNKPVDFHALLGQAGLQPQAKRKKKRHPFRFLFKLVVLLGIVGTGLYFGKIYVLDKRWDSELKPFAEDVSRERGLEWTKALKIETLPPDEYAVKLAATLWPAEAEHDTVGEWRAMGLAEGDVDFETIGSAAMASVPVFYDPVDQKLYQLDGVPRELHEWALDQALTAALLDQHVHWSEGLAEQAPGIRTGVRAIVSGDALITATGVVRPDSDEATTIADQTDELLTEYADAATGAPAYATHLLQPQGPLPTTLASDVDERDDLYVVPIESDAAVFDPARGLRAPSPEAGDPAATRGMMYWYYVLAGRLGSAEAWDVARLWHDDEVQVDGESANGTCVTATVSAVDAASGPVLFDAFTRWAVAGPVAAGTTVEMLGTEQVRIFACDPGAEADTVTSDSIQFFGESGAEWSALTAADATTAELRDCVLNAVRAYDAVGVQLRGDRATYDQLITDISTACHNPAPAPADAAAPTESVPAAPASVAPAP
ncbi:MAG: hypothetical protein U0Q03_08860 [Acidimicrobiales bacterium]